MNNIWGILSVGLGLVLAPGVVHGQTAGAGGFNAGPSPVQTPVNDSKASVRQVSIVRTDTNGP